MAGLTIREATRADLPAVVALLVDDQLGAARDDASEPLRPAYAAAFDAIAASPGDTLYVACEDAAVVGCFQLTVIPGLSHHGAFRGQIEGVRVASGRRGGGIGHQMMRWAIERCRQRGCRTVQLTTNLQRLDAQRFYRSLGFAATHAGMKLTLP